MSTTCLILAWDAIILNILLVFTRLTSVQRLSPTYLIEDLWYTYNMGLRYGDSKTENWKFWGDRRTFYLEKLNWIQYEEYRVSVKWLTGGKGMKIRWQKSLYLGESSPSWTKF